MAVTFCCYGYGRGFARLVRKMAVRQRRKKQQATAARAEDVGTAGKAGDELNIIPASRGGKYNLTLLSSVGIGKYDISVLVRSYERTPHTCRIVYFRDLR